MHQHSHAHHGHDHPAPKNFNLAFFIAIAVNLIYTIIQIIFAYIANSSSLLADAGHNLSDVLSLIFAWIGNTMLGKKATQTFSYGFKKITVLTALFNALILFTASGLIAAEAISKFFHPRPVHALDIIIVAGIGILVNVCSALLFFKDSKDDLNIKAAFLHLAYDGLVSLGVVIGGIVIYFTHWEIIDPIISLLITVVIILGTWRLLKASFCLAIDAVPSNIKLNDVRQYLLDITAVDAIHDLHVWALSTKETALSVHLVIPTNAAADNLLQEINQTLSQRFHIQHSTIQIEKTNAQCDGYRCN
jgi:cobalt-zinc-cadmium efflux system protein